MRWTMYWTSGTLMIKAEVEKQEKPEEQKENAETSTAKKRKV